jgi:hypothetical protein
MTETNKSKKKYKEYIEKNMTPKYNQPHEFKQHFLIPEICSICRKPAQDALHQAGQPQTNNPIVDKPPQPAPPAETKEHTQASTHASNCPACRALKKFQDETLCIGHICVQCGKEWLHDYKCNKPRNLEAICQNCISQNNVEIHRPEFVLQIEKNGKNILSGQEQAEEFIKHEARIDLMIYDYSGNLLPNYEEILLVHIEGLRKIIERAVIGTHVAGRKILKVKEIETSKLTPEEQAQYKRDAARQKKQKSLSPDDKDKQLAKRRAVQARLIEDGIKAKMAANPKMTLEKARAIVVAAFGDVDSVK